MITRRTLIGSTLLAAADAPALPALAAPAAPHRRGRLTNLAHLRYLLAEAPLPEVPEHSSTDQPAPGLAPWTYADRAEDDTFTRVGGGDRDPATGHWSQGAYNADDISRCAIVFLRAHAVLGEPSELETARDLLRTLTYLQVDSGPRAGNVVLWMQADGTLNPSAIPVELPDPSDSDESYWLPAPSGPSAKGSPPSMPRTRRSPGSSRSDCISRSTPSNALRWTATDSGRAPTGCACRAG